MIAFVIRTLVVLTVVSALHDRQSSGAIVGGEMQPLAVAKTLLHVEEDWKTQAQTFIECELSESKEDVIKDCDDTPPAFSRSCSSVVGAIVQGSQGDPNVMAEYMTDICKQDVMGTWHQSGCIVLGRTIRTHMTASSYDNRMRFPTAPVCDDFWVQFLAEQKTVHQQELAAIKEKERKAAELEAKEAKQAKERAEKARKALEEAEKAREAKEAAVIEAERKMVAHADNATTNKTIDGDLEHEKAVVEAVEEAAKKKIQEATRAEEEMNAQGSSVQNKSIQVVEGGMGVAHTSVPTDIAPESTKADMVAAAPNSSRQINQTAGVVTTAVVAEELEGGERHVREPWWHKPPKFLRQ